MLGKTHHYFSFSNPLVFRLKMGHKIKKIRMGLNKIIAEKDAFNLNQQTNFSSSSRSIWRETHSHVHVSEIIGREMDRDVIVKRLLCPDADKNPFIVSIVGIGGIGKTALAKLVYNDERVKLHFDSRIWVCVSDEFDPKIILQKIINSKVTSAGGSRYDHKLKGLSQGDSISVLKKVFEEGHGSMMNPEILEIASQILDKCRGVPLVVRALGGLLCSNTDIRYWRSIIDEDILAVLHEEGDILPIIRLSYDHLPAYLKRLFAFCSLFRKDYLFNNIILGEYWIASGLISTSHNNQKPEEACNHYIKELLARSFFQDFEEHGQIFSLKMHDIVHDLAVSVAQNEYLAVNSHTASISDRVRHLSFSARSENPPNLEELPRDMWKLINLHTLGIMTKEKSLKNSGIEHLKSLRELRIVGCDNLETLFEGMNMEGLACLRRLYIVDCENLTSIPMSSLKFLSSLEALAIWNCGKLHLSMEEEIFFPCLRTLSFIGLPKMLTFPKWVQGAANTLQSVLIKNCQQLGELPEWLHRLSRLEALRLVGCDGISTLPDGVQDLTALKFLWIIDCSELGGKCLPNGPDWHKIAHIPNIKFDGEEIHKLFLLISTF
ncbi:hypothetical protein CRG98_003271 [Punica granatum]|uniref:NB-ARC domain-containing protein n=1 Tax=Punica granatum TaxID=22663 RepID=A0A2I0L6L6_PUNGR|nr:hypothetical protein CRG98_003271 [Punica granatum]